MIQENRKLYTFEKVHKNIEIIPVKNSDQELVEEFFNA